MSRTVCSCDHRCVGGSSGGGGGGSIQCCNTACAAGCSGGNASQCHVSVSCSPLSLLHHVDCPQACRQLNNNGECVSSCPDEFIIVNGAITQNPEFRVEAGTQCIVPPCPGQC